MFDQTLRPWKTRVLAPVAGQAAWLPPNVLTAAGLGLGLTAAFAVAVQAPGIAVALWLANRVIDGLDGEVARLNQRQTDLGGYLDILADMSVYAALSVALGWQAGTTLGWVATAVLLASFYLNTASWMFLSAVLSRRPDRPQRSTTIEMPTGLVEGVETIVLFTAMLLVPHVFAQLALAMAALVFFTVAQRVAWSIRNL